MRTVSHAWQRGTKVVRPGDELVVKGIRGNVRFRFHVALDSGSEWVEVVSPEFGFHAVRPDRVLRIPRHTKLRDAPKPPKPAKGVKLGVTVVEGGAVGLAVA